MQDTDYTVAELMAIAGPPNAPARPQPQQPAQQPQARQAPVQAPANGNLTPEALFPALVQQESRGRAGAVGPNTQWGNALGRTQMLPATAREMAQRVGVPFDESMLRGTSPEAAAYQDRLGMAYLQEGFERTGNPREALMYYHGGPDRRLWGPKTRQYAEDVLGRVASGDLAQVSTRAPQATPADDYSVEELMALAEQDAPAPTGPQMYNGRPVKISVTDPIQADEAGVYDLRNPTAAMNLESLGRGDQVVLSDNVRRTLRGAPYSDNSRSTDEQVGSFNLRAPNATDTVGAYASASTEQIPGADEAATQLSAMLNGQTFSERRAQVLDQRDRMNETDRGARVAGGWTGFGLGLAAPGGQWVQGGRAATRLAQGTMAGNQAMRAARAGRAVALGSGYGAAYGSGAAEGGLSERLQAGAIGAGLGAATGGLFQVAGDRLARSAAQAQPNAARRLSRQGVDLLPGQMMSEVPVVGQVVKYAEDALGAFNPFMGGVRARQDEQVIRAAGNEALGHIGVNLPERARTGYEVSQAVIGTLGNAYDEILPRVSAQADDELGTGLRDMMGRASETLDDSRLSRLNRILNDHVINRFAEDGTLAGEQFKRIETTLRQQSERANRPNSTLEDQDLSEFLDEARNIVRDLIARQNPAEAARIRQINAGYAVGKRVQRAVSGSPQMAREGTPTPGELTQTVRQMSSDGQVANQSALLQRLASDARTVLPPRMGDTGSGQRAVIGGALGVLGTGGAAAVNPLLAGGLIAGAGLYSRPGVAAMNAAYRLTDRPGATAEGLSALAAAARQNPALVPVYERALLQSQLAGQNPGPGPRPAARGLFGARRPQTVPQQ